MSTTYSFLKYSFFKFLRLMISGMLLSFPVIASAKIINLYDQPQLNAKVVKTVDLSVGIIPIYAPKNDGWIKVADPRNGNVGWVKSSDLQNLDGTQSIFTFTQSIDNKIPVTYRMIQFGQPTKLTPEQANVLAKQMQTEQQAMQKSIQNMIKNMDQLFYNEAYFLHQGNFPFFVPAVIVPIQNTTQSPSVHKAPSTLPAATPTTNADNKTK